ncbi:proline-tRNA ligase [Paracoccidioides brasiliensis Pb18]|uniref:proline--tRNA ligase n=1 Tax=Paracoccidioides brasiliensis (strain Pb18) TaxID=502780 RepID=C1G6W3_PARBD|nr:proline-tRNA ligase [Paracoccidioides brasiliensis Pb18]EEH46820.2 proline-tRNA ligase [Paracoccidioides brasiliensis Pb18]
MSPCLELDGLVDFLSSRILPNFTDVDFIMMEEVDSQASGLRREESAESPGLSAYSGVFHLLPLGLRVQEKLERLIDKHMRTLGASKLSLSSISSQALWEKSGRLKKDSEFFKFEDRKEARFLLAPTHEEEITSLVASSVSSYRDLPLRLYQFGRKYRDEPRPRQGLLRGREFMMKDLYTFDYSAEKAIETYNAVKEAYIRLFDELKLPYIVAAADSGNMGGSLSHEFHLPNSKGEDTIVSCSSCGHVYNEELSDGKAYKDPVEQSTYSILDTESAGLGKQQAPTISTDMWMSISKDRKTLVRVFYSKYLVQEGHSDPVERKINSHAVRAIAREAGVDLDAGVSSPLMKWQARASQDPQVSAAQSSYPAILDIYDHRVRPCDRPPLPAGQSKEALEQLNVQFSSIHQYPGTNVKLDCVSAAAGDRCSKCGENSVETHTAIELAHTFHLGTRYSDVLNASVAIPSSILRGSLTTERTALAQSSSTVSVPLEMGCHGIGVSRMIAAVADTLADPKGLNWPRVISPFDVIIISDRELEKEAEQVYDTLMESRKADVDAIIDDREKSLTWKLRDADLIGYPVIIVIGKLWKRDSKLEIQCRRLENFRETVSLQDLRFYTKSLLDRL